MKWKLAWKAFLKALKEPAKALLFLKEEEKEGKEDKSHLRLLSLLQQQGRLIDFLKEDISHYSDAQIGAAVRQIHASSAKSLEEFVAIRPVLQAEEGTKITVSVGYNPQEIKVVGRVKGSPPYQGVVRHPGWKAHKISLPKEGKNSDISIVFPAEVEV